MSSWRYVSENLLPPLGYFFNIKNLLTRLAQMFTSLVLCLMIRSFSFFSSFLFFLSFFFFPIKLKNQLSESDLMRKKLYQQEQYGQIIINVEKLPTRAVEYLGMFLAKH